MKKFILYSVLFVFLVIGFLMWKTDFHMPKLLLRNVKAWIFKDRINQMFKENQVLIDRVLSVCENTDGENKAVDKSDQIDLSGHAWIANCWGIVFNEKSDELNIDDALKNKIMDQLRPIRSGYRKLIDKYKDILDQKSQQGSGIDKKLVGYTLKELWGELYWMLGSSLADDLNDYRRKKKVITMQIIGMYFGYNDLENYLKDRILLEAAESGELEKAFLQAR